MNSLYAVLENTVGTYPDNEALIFGETRISYSGLQKAVERLAMGLKTLGLQSGERIGLMLPNVPHFPVTLFALLKLGVTVVPISIFYSSQDIQHILNDAQLKGIIFWEGFRDEVTKALAGDSDTIRIVLTDEAQGGEIRLSYLMEMNESLKETVPVDEHDTALIAYTSGTTGQPMGVELTHQNLTFDIDACQSVLKLKSKDRVLGVLPLYHPLGLTLILGSFLGCGGSIVLIPRFDTEDVQSAIEKEKTTYFVSVPSMLEELIKSGQEDQRDLSALKYCICSGEALKTETMESFEAKYNVPILEGYELTEASPVVSLNNPRHDRKPGSIGLPLPGVDMKIVDENGSEVRPGSVGEIIVKGPNVMKGYFNHPEETKKVLKDGWLHTGDLALLKDDGLGYIVDREKNIIVKGGFDVFPREVEEILNKHEKVKEAAVVGVPDPIQGEEIYASVVLVEGEQPTQEEIVEFCKQQTPAYKCPKVIHFVTALPKGPTGRVMRNKLKEQFVRKSGGA